MNKIVCVILVLPALHAYSTGPPNYVCSSMMPGHGGSPQSLPSPFSVVLTTSTYRRGQNVSVEVVTSDSVNSPFRGFLLQARIDGTSTATGRFYVATGDSQVRLISCSGGNSNTVSHNSPVPKSVKRFTWVSETGGSVYFQATFVKERMTYWTGIRSNTINEEVTTTTTTTSPTTTTSTSTTTTPTMSASTTTSTSTTTTTTTPSTTTTTPPATTSLTTTTSPTTTTITTSPATSDSGDSSSPSTTTSAGDNSPTTTSTTTTAPTTRGQVPSVNDGATTASSSHTAISSLWSVLGLVIIWTIVMY